MHATDAEAAMVSAHSHGTCRCRSRSRSARCSNRLQPSDTQPSRQVSVELIQLGSHNVICFDIDAGASIGQLCVAFKNAAFDKFTSNDLFESHEYGAIVLINPGSTPRMFKLSDIDHEFMNTDEIRQAQCMHNDRPLQFQLLRLKHSWTNPSTARISDLPEPSISLQGIIERFKDMKHELPELVRLAEVQRLASEFPWDAIAMDIANNIDRRGALLDSAQAIMDVDRLRTYTNVWMSQCQFVKKLISWEAFTSDSAAKDMQVLSTPGGYLADYMFMLVSIERMKLKSACRWATVSNSVYVYLASVMEIRHPAYCGANNVGNTMEALIWLAYEQKKYKFIISVIHHAANLQWNKC